MALSGSTLILLPLKEAAGYFCTDYAVLVPGTKHFDKNIDIGAP